MGEMTVGDLKRQLDGLAEDTKVSFHAGLTFYRLKRWSKNEVVLEFNEYEADLPRPFRTKNPDVVAVFIRSEAGDGSSVGIGTTPRF